MTLTVGELFAGYGGLGLAVEEVFGAELAWYAEYDPAPSKIMAHHYPNLTNYGDVTDVDWANVPHVDIISGGYPCQPFSQAGARKGLEDDRHLWPYVSESMDVIRPTYGVFENVRGHLSLGFDQVIRDLHLLNYSATWTVLKASDVGAPHRRERIFLLAKDNNAPVRSRPNRRRGIHRDSGNRRVISTTPEGRDDRQGTPGTTRNGTPVWREDQRRESQKRAEQGSFRLEGDRSSGGFDNSTDQAMAAREERCSRDRDFVSDDARGGPKAAERPDALVARDAVQGSTTEGSYTGSEQAWTDAGREQQGPGRKAAGEVQGGPLVEHGRFPFWAGTVRGEVSNVWSDGRWRDLRIESGTNAWISGDTPQNPDSATSGQQRQSAPRQAEGGRTWADTGRRSGTPTTDAGGSGWDGREGVGGNGGNEGIGSQAIHHVGDGDLSRTDVNWGPYAPAIARWQAVRGPAPAPTELTAKGKHRLSADFAAWMMGIPRGWVTDPAIGISRNEQLKAIGNGVVPAQASAALRHMLNYERRAS